MEAARQREPSGLGGNNRIPCFNEDADKGVFASNEFVFD
jgi:hypothetical protein